ncbi:ROK family protein [Abyssisolibacter fermentans]|uniref:ROK family protein n=1 Tax=Abyssisolibacter fermentans TaxID=1766203 RepID=UPI0012E36C30|nr:ROK family protein [Abyssisolibacter fermentans]
MQNVIAIDLGGTKIKGGVIDEQGRLLKTEIIATEAFKGKETILNKMVDMIEKLKKNYEIQAIGIGSPGFIDLVNGKVLFVGSNFPGWQGTNIREEIERRFNIPTIVDNDANVAALCESWIGSANEMNSFVMITLGTGVGGSLYIREDGIWRGNNWQAGELGHIILYPNGKKCGCGQSGCVEQYVSGNALEKAYEENNDCALNGKDIFKKASQGDLGCIKIVDKFIYDLSIYLVSLKNIFDPEAIIIGGGLINSKEFWLEKLQKSFKEMCNSSLQPQILSAKYLNDAGMIGAAKLAFDYIT